MCLLVFAWQTDDEHPLVFAGNRDERHARASAAAAFWPDAPEILGGRDLEAGGTWLGITTAGRFAVVTNYREGLNPPKTPRSRGELPADFLRGNMSAADYMGELQRRGGDYGGFSLICGDGNELWYCSNRGAAPLAIAPGIHGLSNHLLDTPWPKVEHSKARLAMLLEQDVTGSDALFKLLADRTPASDAELPDTGIGRDLEHTVSSPFVLNPVYGTRCSTAIRFNADGSRHFAERRFDPESQALETRYFQLGAGLP
jgi:uncharacterized protein with NRDE domain